MKLWVDDIRNAPDDSWNVARTVSEAIKTIATMKVEHISLDHDISHQVSIDKMSRPYACGECFCAVAYFIVEKYVDNRSAMMPKISIHTANPVAAVELQYVLRGAGIEPEIIRSKPVNRLEMEVE